MAFSFISEILSYLISITSPSSENAKVEQHSLHLNPPLILNKGELSSG